MPVLVCGLPDEEPVAMAIHSLQKLGADFLVLDQEDLANNCNLRWKMTDGGISGNLRIGGDIIDIREITSVYHRFFKIEDIRSPDTGSPQARKSRSVMRALMDLFDILPARIVNRRRPMMSNNSKPYQALLIRKSGFSIPDTLITNDPGRLMEFASGNIPLIYKSISSVRSIVAPLDEKAMAKIKSLRNLPTQFQRRIDGFNVRVHVIGNRLFATQILSMATDYRYASLENVPAEFRPFELNVDLRRRCIRLARICNLDFAGIDLIIDTERVYCLEINPSPGYSYYQKSTGQQISDALAKYLNVKK